MVRQFSFEIAGLPPSIKTFGSIKKLNETFLNICKVAGFWYIPFVLGLIHSFLVQLFHGSIWVCDGLKIRQFI